MVFKFVINTQFYRKKYVCDRENKYFDTLIKKENRKVNVITRIRHCDKLYLLFEMYHKYLSFICVDDEYIIEFALDINMIHL